MARSSFGKARKRIRLRCSLLNPRRIILTDGLDYIISLRREHYQQQQRERTLNEGDRVAVLGRGVAVVEQADEKEVKVILGSGEALRIAREDIVLSQRNLRWECRIRS